MRMFAALIAASWFAFAAGAQRPAAVSTADLVELDVVALDRNGQSVTDLRQDEVTIKEDGHPVETKTFAKVTALGSLQPDRL